MQNIKKFTCWLGIAVFAFSHVVLASDDWVLKSEHHSLSRELLKQTLKARGFSDVNLPDKQKVALLQELFIRESLLAQQDKIPVLALETLEAKLNDYRRGQLARLALDALSAADMPDFAERALELYEVRQYEQYQLPLRLRVRVLRKSIVQSGSTEKDVVDVLRELVTKINRDEISFEQAVSQHSDDPKRKLTGGDSFWFQRGQQPEFIYNAAEKLSSAQPVSDVLVSEQEAYILQFLGRQEAVQQSFAEVKSDIIKELQAEYRDEQRKLILTKLRDRFQQDVEIHSDFQ